MEATELAVELRNRTGKGGAASVRRGGGIPAVIYGADEPPKPLSVSDAVFHEILRAGGSRLSLLSLNIKAPAGDQKEPAIIKAIQRHPVTEHIIHIDFMRVALKEKLSLDVPIQIEGSAPGVKLGGVLQQAIRQVQVRCLPTQIPEAAIANVSNLEIGGALKVKDLRLPEDVELLSEPEQSVLSITVVKYEEETAATPADAPAGTEAGAEPAQPEVIGEKEREERKAKKEEGKGTHEKEKQELKEIKTKEEKKSS